MRAPIFAFSSLAFVGAALLLTSAPPARATENLLRNGGFDENLSGWSRAGSVSYTPFGSGAPGAARVTQTDDPRGADVLLQCVAITGGRLYDAAASAYLPWAPEGSGAVDVHVRWHASSDCSGRPLRGTPSMTFSQVGPVAWQRRSLRMLPAPTEARSAIFVVVARADAPDTYSLLVDDLFFAASEETEVLVVPTAASVTGARGERFRTDVWIQNPAPAERTVTFTMRCPAERPCPSAAITRSIGARETLHLDDAVAQIATAVPAGALEIAYDPRGGPLEASARVVTVHPAAPGTGAAIPVVRAADARTGAAFFGLAPTPVHDGPDARVNAGAYNPQAVPVTATFRVKSASGQEIGAVTRTWAPRTWMQIDDVLAAAGAGPAVGGSWIEMESALPIHPFVVSVDNASGDGTLVLPTERHAIP